MIYKNYILKAMVDMCFWVWLCFSSVTSIAILIKLHFLAANTHLIFNGVCILSTACFIPYYIRRIILTIKQNISKNSNDNSSAFLRNLQKGFIMFPNILLSSLLAGLSLLFENWKMLFIILSILTMAIGMGVLAMKSIGKLEE